MDQGHRSSQNMSSCCFAFNHKPRYICCQVTKPRGRTASLQRLELPFLLPHLMFANLFRTSREQFNEKFFGSDPHREQRLYDFWSGVVASGDPRLDDHPMQDKLNWMKRAIPLTIHGDAVPVVRVGRPGCSSLECLSVQSLLADGATMRVKLLLFSMFEANKVSIPISPVWQHITSS